MVLKKIKKSELNLSMVCYDKSTITHNTSSVSQFADYRHYYHCQDNQQNTNNNT